MSSPAPISPQSGDPRIDLYIDGLLEGEQLATFERELSSSASLRAELESQERIDSELRRMFSYEAARATLPVVAPAVGTPAPDVIGRVDGSAVTPVVRSRTASRLRWYALAAVITLSGAAILNSYVQRRLEIQRGISPTTVYAMVDKPEFVCKDDQEFAAAVQKQLGQPLVLAVTPGVSALGWAYGDNYSGKIVGDNTMVLITKVDGEKVLVFMDRLRDDRKLDEKPLGDNLKLFRREVGRLVLYEVTPLDRPRVIESLKVPEK